MSGNGSKPSRRITLVNRVTCPHCWNIFPPDQALWIAQHPDLLGDPRLGAEQSLRFLPTRFNIDGAAIDSRGFPCHGLACPKCHLPVPRSLFEMGPMFLSILGAPACGKSYFLAALTWQLRNVLPKQFGLTFSDADPISNHRLHEYEELQFLNADSGALVEIKKTEEQGDLYDTVLFGEQPVSYPRPFMFTLRPAESHPNSGASGKLSRVVCLYDNAGESFLPGHDTATSPVTRHLALSRALLFLFDPTQDPRFRRACQGKTTDPQMQERSQRLEREASGRQETLLLEAAERVRRYAGLSARAKHNRPLILIVTKYDAWSSLLDAGRLPQPWSSSAKNPVSAMQLETIEKMSAQVRALLWKLSPEVVSAAESFTDQVLYVPVSATGRSPEIDPVTGAKGFRPRDIHPMWVEVPLLYTLSRWSEGLIPYVRQGAPATNPAQNAKAAGASGVNPLPPSGNGASRVADGAAERAAGGAPS
jgi:hypothetical protein